MKSFRFSIKKAAFAVIGLLMLSGSGSRRAWSYNEEEIEYMPDKFDISKDKIKELLKKHGVSTKRVDDVLRVLGWLSRAKEACIKWKVPLAWLLSFIFHESSGNPKATSYRQNKSKDFIDEDGNVVAKYSDLKNENGKWKGKERPPVSAHLARGLTQFIKGTGASYGLSFDELYDPIKSLDVGAHFLYDLYDEIGKEWLIRPIAAGYVSGIGNALAAKDGYYTKGKRRGKDQGDPYTPGDYTKTYMNAAEKYLALWNDILAEIKQS